MVCDAIHEAEFPKDSSLYYYLELRGRPVTTGDLWGM